MRQLGTRADGATCPSVALDLLRFRPDHELQARDVWEALSHDWPLRTVANSLERLAVRGSVVRIRDGRSVWYAIAPAVVARFYRRRRTPSLVQTSPRSP